RSIPRRGRAVVLDHGAVRVRPRTIRGRGADALVMARGGHSPLWLRAGRARGRVPEVGGRHGWAPRRTTVWFRLRRGSRQACSRLSFGDLRAGIGIARNASAVAGAPL